MVDGVKSLYKVYEDTPSVEVVFFAGLEDGFEEE